MTVAFDATKNEMNRVTTLQSSVRWCRSCRRYAEHPHPHLPRTSRSTTLPKTVRWWHDVKGDATRRWLIIKIDDDAPKEFTIASLQNVCAEIQAIVDDCKLPIRVRCEWNEAGTTPNDRGFVTAQESVANNAGVLGWLLGNTGVAIEGIASWATNWNVSYTHHITWSTTGYAGKSYTAQTGRSSSLNYPIIHEEGRSGRGGSFLNAYANIIAHEAIWHGLLSNTGHQGESKYAEGDMRTTKGMVADTKCQIQAETCEQIREAFGIPK